MSVRINVHMREFMYVSLNKTETVRIGESGLVCEREREERERWWLEKEEQNIKILFFFSLNITNRYENE